MNIIKKTREEVLDLLDNDEITPEEAAFMIGYVED